MSDDTTRDAKADLAVCAAATPGPWTWEDGPATVYSGRTDDHHGLNLLGRLEPDWNGHNNLDFIAMARTALPHWIERATAAEAEVERLRALLLDGQTPDTCPVCFGNGEVLHLKPDGTLTGHGGCKACYGTGTKQSPPPCPFCNGKGENTTGYVLCDINGIHDSRETIKCIACDGTGVRREKGGTA